MGFAPNSMLYGSNAKRAYAVCDPRKLEDDSHGGGNGNESSIHIFDVPEKHRYLSSPKGKPMSAYVYNALQ